MSPAVLLLSAISCRLMEDRGSFRLHRADANTSASLDRRAVACVYQAKSCEIDWAHKEFMAKQIAEQGFDGGTVPVKAKLAS